MSNRTLARLMKLPVCAYLVVFAVITYGQVAVGAGANTVSQGVSCTFDSECDDSNACTLDQCVNNVCASTTTAGCVPCTFDPICPPLDVVFIMDTSGSMADEAAALCGQMTGVVADLALQGIDVNPVFLGITETPGRHFSCLTDNVVNLLGSIVPGDGGTCQFPDTFSSRESWGPATAIVANEFPWTLGARRIIIPISDEGSCDGSFPAGCSDPGADRDAITNAMLVARSNNVIVAPILGTGSDACVLQLASDLASGTGGVTHQTQDPGTDLAGVISGIMQQFCVDPCNDLDDCTVNDACHDTGICTGTPIDTLTCTTDADCLFSVCDQATGACSCVLEPDLCLEPANPSIACYNQGDVFDVYIRLGVSSAGIFGGQFNIQYDPSKLKFMSVIPGSAADANSPFSAQLAKIIDEGSGSIFYAVGTPFQHPGSNGEVPMAMVTFQALTACDTTDICFINDGPKDTLLTDTKGSSVTFHPCCLTNLRVTGAPPEMVCPTSVSTGLDARATTATITWNPPTAVGGCDGPLSVDCSATSNGSVIDPTTLIAGGGVFLPGHYEFHCVTQDSCGESASCQWTVDVANTHTMEVDVELSPPILADQVNRCLELTVFSDCAQDPLTIKQDVTFVRQRNTAFAHVTLDLPRGVYTCVTARDPKHTLPSSGRVTISNNVYQSSCVGDPLLNGNWLIGGDLDGSAAIDLVDLATLITQMNTTLDPNTPCGTAGRHADINGDGLVDALDEAFILESFQLVALTTCCPLVVPSSVSGSYGIVTSLTIKELRQHGWPELEAADANADGMVNAAELITFGNRRSSSIDRKVRHKRTNRRKSSGR